MLDFSESRLPPFDHQRSDVPSLIANPYYFIASEMRTGKTKIVIDAAQFMFRMDMIDRVIVIAPEPVRSVWADEQFGELQKHLWRSTSAMITEFHSKIKQWHFHTDDSQTHLFRWIVSNYEFVRPYRRKNAKTKNDAALKKLLQYCTPKTLLVLDESSAVTNHDSEQFDACYKMRQLCGRVVLMDGTPMDTPLNLFALGKMLHASVLDCNYITHFKNRYAIQTPVVGRSGKGITTPRGRQIMKITGWTNLDDLTRRFAPFTVRRLQADCKDMPQKLPAITFKAPLTETTWSHYKSMRDDMIVELESGNASIAQQAITKLMRLSQITGGFLGGVEDSGITEDCIKCRGIGYLDEQYTIQCDLCHGAGLTRNAREVVSSVRELGREKLDVLLWLVRQQLDKDKKLKIIVWARFFPEVERILREASRAFPQMIVAGLHGHNSKKERAYVKSLLHPESSPDEAIFVCGTLGTGSFGLDFSASHTNVNYSYNHSLRKFLQSGDRVYGPNQKSPINYFDIVAVGPDDQKTYDAVIVQARRDKQDIANWVTADWVKALKDAPKDVVAA